MRIAIVTDAWRPQVNGVVTTLSKTGEALEAMGHTVEFFTPSRFRTVPCPSYPEIRLSLFPRRRLWRALDSFAPEAIHIATEGPLGLSARAWCLRRGRAFTTSYHTQFPQYVRMRVPVPLSWSYAYLRWFHGPAERTLVPTEHQRQELERQGFAHLAIWTRGVDTELFRPYTNAGEDDALEGPRPICLYMGRVAVEKNIEAFLTLETPGTRYVVGDGPDLAMLREKYPHTHFTGFRFGEALARTLAAADVFVFPSRTDTFGLVMLEAMACGLPVAAYPVTGPLDVVRPGVTGVLDEDLGKAVEGALQLERKACRAHALSRSWRHASEQFFNHLAINTAQSGQVSSSPATPLPGDPL